jgi:hypothetical protein
MNIKVQILEDTVKSNRMRTLGTAGLSCGFIDLLFFNPQVVEQNCFRLRLL